MCDAATQINIALVNELCFPKWMMALMVLVVVKFLTHQEHLRPRAKRSLTTPQEINLTNPERYHSLNVCQSGHFVCKKETAKRRSRGETGAISSMPPVAKGGNEGVSHEANCCCWHRRVFGHSGVIRSLKEKLHKFPEIILVLSVELPRSSVCASFVLFVLSWCGSRSGANAQPPCLYPSTSSPQKENCSTKHTKLNVHGQIMEKTVIYRDF